MNNNIDISIIVSVFNEEDNLLNFILELEDYIKDYNYDVTFVNDGSYDKSLSILKKIKDTHQFINIISFSRNFGHEAAMLAGIDNAQGNYIICLDADLQHPPKKIIEMIEKAKLGFDIVTTRRISREDGGFIKKILSKIFYKFLNKISPVEFEQNASDFFLISRKIKLILQNEYRERTRFLRGFIQSVGFKKTHIEYNATKRKAGESSYSFFSLIKLSINAIIAFSKLPLYLGIYLGVIFGLFSIVIAIYSLIMKFIDNTPPGYTTLIIVISLLFSIQFFIIGIIGVYIGFLFEEQKKRPIYIIDKFYN